MACGRRSGRNAGEFHYLHQVSVDSKGNIYTGEVDTAKRVQKFKEMAIATEEAVADILTPQQVKRLKQIALQQRGSQAFAEADVVVSRSGMGTVSELAAAGKPSILVPLPTASDQHQLRNAEALTAAGAARLVLDNEMNGARLVQEVMELACTPGLLENMGDAARAFAKPGAAKRAADILESFAAARD